MGSTRSSRHTTSHCQTKPYYSAVSRREREKLSTSWRDGPEAHQPSGDIPERWPRRRPTKNPTLPRRARVPTRRRRARFRPDRKARFSDRDGLSRPLRPPAPERTQLGWPLRSRQGLGRDSHFANSRAPTERSRQPQRGQPPIPGPNVERPSSPSNRNPESAKDHPPLRGHSRTLAQPTAVYVAVTGLPLHGIPGRSPNWKRRSATGARGVSSVA